MRQCIKSWVEAKRACTDTERIVDSFCESIGNSIELFTVFLRLISADNVKVCVLSGSLLLRQVLVKLHVKQTQTRIPELSKCTELAYQINLLLASKTMTGSNSVQECLPPLHDVLRVILLSVIDARSSHIAAVSMSSHSQTSSAAAASAAAVSVSAAPSSVSAAPSSVSTRRPSVAQQVPPAAVTTAAATTTASKTKTPIVKREPQQKQPQHLLSLPPPLSVPPQSSSVLPPPPLLSDASIPADRLAEVLTRCWELASKIDKSSFFALPVQSARRPSLMYHPSRHSISRHAQLHTHPSSSPSFL